jgi:hypothetical protein
MEKRLVFGKKNGFGGVIYERFLGDVVEKQCSI